MLLDHVNLRCRNPERMLDFIDRLGCAGKGRRPDFDSHGFWMYDDSARAVIHISAMTESTNEDAQLNASGIVDHIAFQVTESGESLKARLLAANIDFTERVNTLAGVTQVLVPAPEGLLIELQVPLDA